MTLHVIMGDGEMTHKELAATLNDLWEKEGDGMFWFLIQGKSNPTSTDQALTNWLAKNDLFYAIITDDKASLHPCYSSAAETHVAKNLAKKVISLIASEPEEGEDVDVLGLFTSDDPDSEEDRWLNDLMGEIAEAGHTIRALNDGLTVLDFESEPEAEEEEAPVPTKSKTKPKLAAVPEPADEDQANEIQAPEVTPEEELTQEYLEGLELAGLKELAKERGIELPPRTRTTTYINALLGIDDTPEAEVEEIAASNGHSAAPIDFDDIAVKVADILIKKLAAALS